MDILSNNFETNSKTQKYEKTIFNAVVFFLFCLILQGITSDNRSPY